ncbi:hypothetical protein [Spirillospora sp. NPDC047279]|uniref:hypothetical protein n=1 Tax=Spirillospora sp. NPDC047279 TaxID=3155478 RepID=UPI0033D252AD
MAQMVIETGTETAALEELAQALTRHGHLTMIVTSGGRPRLEVLARATASRSGTVVCEADAGGEQWFWWTWADRIAPVRELERAALLVDGGLRPAASFA